MQSNFEWTKITVCQNNQKMSHLSFHGKNQIFGFGGIRVQL